MSSLRFPEVYSQVIPSEMAKEKVHIFIPADVKGTIRAEVIDVKGATLSYGIPALEHGKNEIVTATWQSGAYIFKLQLGTETLSKTIIIE